MSLYNLHDVMALWNHAHIKVLDIRRSVVLPGESARFFRLPASMFLFMANGRGLLLLDGESHALDNSYVGHAGKGASLEIDHVTELIDYYIVYYKAVMALPCRQELLELYRSSSSSPFLKPYGFSPVNALQLYKQLEQMDRHWQLDDPLEKFHVRAMFHEWVYEVMSQLRRVENAPVVQTDPISRAIRYIESHYAEDFDLRELAELLACSPRQLQRLFKEQVEMGPMEYLIQVRLEQAQRLLTDTGATVKEIAEAVGYVDFYYFSRAFKKQYGVSPMHYRRQRRIRSSFVSHPSIGSGSDLSYSYIDDENHYQYIREGDAHMYARSRLLAVNVMLVLMLILGACSGGTSAPSNAGSPTGQPSENSATSPAQSARQKAYPVTVKHARGEFTLEQKPQRIAVLDVQYIDQLVTLDERPSASVKAAGGATDFPEYLNDKLSNVKVLGTYQEPSLEAILASNPDFIICTEVHEAIYGSLSKIAPTVMLMRNEDWRDTLITIGKLMGKEQEAKQVVQAYKEKTAKLSANLASKLNGQTVALIRPRDDMIRVHTPEHRTGAVLYQDLGLPVPKAVTEADDTAYHISLEALADVGANHYFLLTDEMFKGLVQQFQSTTTWQSLEPVKNKRVYTVDTTMWIGYYGPMAINLIVDQVAEALLGKS
ncbi:AraC family transcriptional regulator [Paenibacillus hemerocallicola]|nr:AraC family transcriptional regulator [Paenibacillus hemerocallicola]